MSIHTAVVGGVGRGEAVVVFVGVVREDELVLVIEEGLR